MIIKWQKKPHCNKRQGTVLGPISFENKRHANFVFGKI